MVVNNCPYWQELCLSFAKTKVLTRTLPNDSVRTIMCIPSSRPGTVKIPSMPPSPIPTSKFNKGVPRHAATWIIYILLIIIVTNTCTLAEVKTWPQWGFNVINAIPLSWLCLNGPVKYRRPNRRPNLPTQEKWVPLL